MRCWLIPIKLLVATGVVRKNLVRAIMKQTFPANIHDVSRLKSHRS